MDLTSQRRFLTAGAACFLAVAAVGVVWALGGIDGAERTRSSAGGPPSATGPRAAANDSDSPPRNDPAAPSKNRVDLSLPLLDPLYQPPPPPKTRPSPTVVRKERPPVVKAPKLDWTLAGTIIEPRGSVAILTDASGNTDIRSVGEEVELSPKGVLVRKIDSDKVTLEVRGKQSTLQLEQSFRSGGGGGNPGRPNRGRNR